MRDLLSNLQARLDEYMEDEQSILQNLAKERERNQFLESELAQKETRMVQMSSQNKKESLEREEENDLMNESELRETEQYLNELETQLQQARTELLGAKLQLSDN